MKKHIAILGLLTLFIGTVQAQERPGSENLEAWKVAFITERLNLSSQEAQDFWPLYNEFQAKNQKLNVEAKKHPPMETMSDAEVEAFVFKRLDVEQRQLDLKKEYVRKMKSVIPIRKIALLNKVEADFRAWIVQRIKDTREPKQKPQRRRRY